MWAQPLPLGGKELVEEREPLVGLFRGQIGAGEIAHPGKRGGVVGAELRPRSLQGLLAQGQSILQTVRAVGWRSVHRERSRPPLQTPRRDVVKRHTDNRQRECVPPESLGSSNRPGRNCEKAVPHGCSTVNRLEFDQTQEENRSHSRVFPSYEGRINSSPQGITHCGKPQGLTGSLTGATRLERTHERANRRYQGRGFEHGQRLARQGAHAFQFIPDSVPGGYSCFLGGATQVRREAQRAAQDPLGPRSHRHYGPGWSMPVGLRAPRLPPPPERRASGGVGS
jgi:hypothetical protein